MKILKNISYVAYMPSRNYHCHDKQREGDDDNRVIVARTAHESNRVKFSVFNISWEKEPNYAYNGRISRSALELTRPPLPRSSHAPIIAFVISVKRRFLNLSMKSKPRTIIFSRVCELIFQL